VDDDHHPAPHRHCAPPYRSALKLRLTQTACVLPGATERATIELMRDACFRNSYEAATQLQGFYLKPADILRHCDFDVITRMQSDNAMKSAWRDTRDTRHAIRDTRDDIGTGSPAWAEKPSAPKRAASARSGAANDSVWATREADAPKIMPTALRKARAESTADAWRTAEADARPVFTPLSPTAFRYTLASQIPTLPSVLNPPRAHRVFVPPWKRAPTVRRHRCIDTEIVHLLPQKTHA
jgi:hypothetical protein